jgi:retinol dehydrogenase 12
MTDQDMQGKTVVITGANTGIGFAAARALAFRGAHTVMVSRNETRGRAAEATLRNEIKDAQIDVLWADFQRFDEVRRLGETLRARCPRIDVLINNAGLILSERVLTPDGLECMLQVNHLSVFLLTNLLLDRMVTSAPARIVNVASEAHRSGGPIDFDDLQSERSFRPFAVYGRTKLMNILFTRELARRLDHSGVSANSLHPGVVRTGFGQDGDTRAWLKIGLGVLRPFMVSPVQGAKTILHLACSENVSQISGMYFARSKPKTPAPFATDDRAARRLWDVSAKLVRL